MDYHETDTVFKINKMVENFRRLCCCEQCVGSTCYSSSLRNYTNFSVDRILRQGFGGLSAYDSDGSYWAENSEVCSSCDEYETCSNPEVSSSPEPLDLSLKPSKYIEDELSGHDRRSMFLRGLQAEEDGYSSSDSEVAHALDLRVQRKKTPPKRATGIPAWVFCTRYSDRPSAGNYSVF